MSRNDEDTLYHFAMEPNHDRATLERYLTEYPHLAEDLIDLRSELRLGDFIDKNPDAIPDPGLDEAWEEFRMAGE